MRSSYISTVTHFWVVVSVELATLIYRCWRRRGSGFMTPTLLTKVLWWHIQSNIKSTDHIAFLEYVISTEQSLTLHLTQLIWLWNFKLLIRLPHRWAALMRSRVRRPRSRWRRRGIRLRYWHITIIRSHNYSQRSNPKHSPREKASRAVSRWSKKTECNRRKREVWKRRPSTSPTKQELVSEVRDIWTACGWLPGVRPGSMSEYTYWKKCW